MAGDVGDPGGQPFQRSRQLGTDFWAFWGEASGSDGSRDCDKPHPCSSFRTATGLDAVRSEVANSGTAFTRGSPFRLTGHLRLRPIQWPFSLGSNCGRFRSPRFGRGWLGDIPLASHTVAVTLASVTFMVPLGVSIAAVTRVGNLIGRGESSAAATSGWVALGLGAGIMSLSAVGFWLGRHQLPRLFTEDPEVIMAAALILPVAATFQIFDGIQVVGGGILRGMGQTKPAAAFNLLGFYGLALPLAYWLAFPRGLGLLGIWWGLCLGLATVAICLVFWIRAFGPSRAVRLVGP